MTAVTRNARCRLDWPTGRRWECVTCGAAHGNWAAANYCRHEEEDE